MLKLSLICAIFVLFAHKIAQNSVICSEFKLDLSNVVNANEFGPKTEALLGQSSADNKQPVFPERPDAVYFVIALHGGAKIWGRTLARTLLDLGAPFSNPQGPPLRPIIIDLPSNGRYTSKVLTTLCDVIDGVPLAGMIVIGDGQAAKMIALSGSSMKIPVLWAKGGIVSLQGTLNEHMSKSQAILQPSAREILEALRSLLLQTHWYSFYILSDIKTTILLKGAEGEALKRKPLLPTILQLPTNNDLIYRQLERVSQSTRGVVILLCELSEARRILAEAQRMRMLNGHFIWLWADTTTSTEFYDPVQMPIGVFGSDAEEDMSVQLNNPFHSGKTELEDDFYDSTDIIQQSHIADLVERKLDFEYYDPKHKKNRTKADNANRSHHAVDLQKNILNFKNLVGNNKRSDKFKRNVDSQEDLYSENISLSVVSHYPQNGDLKELKRTNSLERRNYLNQSNGATYRFTIDPQVRNQNQKNSVQMSSSDIDNLFGVEENLADFKYKRADSFLRHYNVSSHVLFHHFQDFPVGLLALRPVTMKVDRHFIRSAVRLFASTWAKVEQEADSGRKHIRNQEKQQSSSKINQRNNKSPKYKRSAMSIMDQIDVINTFNNTQKIVENKVNNSNITSDNEINVTESSTYKTSTKSQNREGSSTDSHFSEHGVYDINSQNSSKSNTSDSSNMKSIMTFKQKRQQTWWTSKGRSGDRIKGGAPQYRNGCYGTVSRGELKKAELFTRYLQEGTTRGLTGQTIMGGLVEKSLITHFEVLNLVPVTKRPTVKHESRQESFSSRIVNTSLTKWRRVGFISGRNVHLDTIVWPSGDIVVTGLLSKARSVFRVVVAVAPPFVMETELGDREQCLRGLLCYKVYITGRQNLTKMFNKIEIQKRRKDLGEEIEPEDERSRRHIYSVRCCYGLSMDLLQKVALDLGFEFDLYIVHDGLFGRKIAIKSGYQTTQPRKDVNRRVELSKFDAQSGRSLKRGSKLSQILEMSLNPPELVTDPPLKVVLPLKVPKVQWNGIIGDLVTGSADITFAPLSVSRERARVIDFSIPFFHGGVSLLAAPQTNPDVPLLAFLLPFSPELWIAIFTSLNVTAVAVAIYEWLSPFGLNPWGRQRSKNFSMSSALWVMWGLLCGHLVAFKAPKSWPNKFLINVWGGFSVIFVASYTANIAALIAGLFFHNEAGSYSGPLLQQRIGAPIATATEYYVQQSDKILWEHMKKYQLTSIEEGIERLKNGTIDLLMADSPILDYYRATDQGCSFQKVGDTYIDDSYAIGMTKGFPLKETISALISKYSSDGYLDILTAKWYGSLACFKLDREIGQPKPLGVAAVAGVFLLLGLGMILGLLILIFEHLFYKYTLPILRHQPKNTIWRSRNIMFFSQKLYRFINCVELVSPHHAAKELVHTIRQGQITSLFQKSIKREDEQRRRRKSKAQFFDMIQEIRRNMYLNRVQQQERDTMQQTLTKDAIPEASPDKSITPSKKPKSSPRMSIFGLGRHNSNPSTLNVRRFSTDSILSERLDTIGRRLSRDITNSPPDLTHRFETFGKLKDGDGKFDTYSGKETKEAVAPNKFDTFSGKIENCQSEEKPPELPVKKGKQNRRSPLNPELYVKNKKYSRDESRRLIPISERVAHGLAPPFIESDTSSALLRDKLHEELREKYASHGFNQGILKSVNQNGDSRSSIDVTEEGNRQGKVPRQRNKGNKHARRRVVDGCTSHVTQSAKLI
ncbi:uncharacterized protein LOC109415021 isoform X2 [Aedes albopictus]|uniref:Ionotropic glutamate receptor C-terminal domain-containing protein n=1 Tax=Aedes albopictus TaxID=7160 RepID=A0ABM1Y5Z3_AEDAL